LAAIGSTALTIAAPASAAPSDQHAAGATSTSAPTGGADKPSRHVRLDPNFKPQAPAGSTTTSASTLGSNQETAGPTVPRSWYPEMPHQGG
jgi:hypothetical protein